LKKLILIIMVISTFGCTNQKMMNFSVEVQLSEDNQLSVSNLIKVKTFLVNNNDESVTISHRSPLIQLHIYNADDELVTDLSHWDDYGFSYTLNPGERYNPGEPESINHLSVPGKYKLIAIARFIITDGNRNEERSIQSKPIIVEVK